MKFLVFIFTQSYPTQNTTQVKFSKPTNSQQLLALHSMASTTNYPANLQQIIDAPVEEVTGPRAAKTKAIATMAIPTDAAKAAKARTKRVAAEKKAHKKAHADFKRQLKATRKTLTQIWKEERKKDRLAKAAQKADKKARRKTKALMAKALKAKAPKLTEEQKLMKRARKAYETEMRRRVKFMRQFSEKYMEYRDFLQLDQEGNHTITEWHHEAEEEFGVQLSAEEQEIEITLEDGFVC